MRPYSDAMDGAGVEAHAPLRAHGCDPVFVVRNLGKTFGDHRALDDLSFEAHRGEFLALLGPSGAGKTTLIRCMAGLIAPDRGEVRLDGSDMRSIGRQDRRRIAVVFQQFNLVPRLTAFQNVLAGRLGYVPTWRGVLRRFPMEDRLLALRCLDRVGLLSHARQRADTLSGGQQQRVAIARALAQQPEVILADEPIASLDPQSSAGILRLLREICNTDRVAVVCSLHQVEFARTYAERIIGMTAGRLLVDLPASDFDAEMAARVYSERITAT